MSISQSQWRRPINTSADEAGGIHDDSTAQKLGFSGGTVAGSLHMEQFPPVLIAHFGESWWQRGGLSLYFKQATFDGDPVRCCFEPESDHRGKVWMENEAGDVIMSGTASLGDDPNSEIRQRLAKVRPAQDLRMLQDVVPHKTCETLSVRASDAEIDERLRVITEPLPLYATNPEQNSKWGGRVLPAAPFVHIFRGVEAHVAPIRGPYVGLYGAIELQYLNGPVVSEQNYNVNGHALAVSESPKTEILWYEATLTDQATGEPVARMVKMDRLMKDASPLWG